MYNDPNVPIMLIKCNSYSEKKKGSILNCIIYDGQDDVIDIKAKNNEQEEKLETQILVCQSIVRNTNDVILFRCVFVICGKYFEIILTEFVRISKFKMMKFSTRISKIKSVCFW